MVHKIGVISLFLFMLRALWAVPSLGAALEMSSKKECAICHIMWLDDFRTAKETLIAWQPGNVLMKDTQGVVSSEEICYSCHDGYVGDSRAEVWKYNNHKTFIKPSAKVKAPSSLPLSNKGEIYCGTCHTAHGLGSAPDGTRVGPASFMRLSNADSNLCLQCHVDEAAFQRTNGHPVNTQAVALPDAFFALGGKKATVRNKIICQSCHKVHGARGAGLTLVANQNSQLCVSCHDRQESLIGTRHDLRLSWPQEQNIKQQQPAHSGPCGACHTPHKAAGPKLWARQLPPGNQASQMCLSCHAQSSDHPIKGIGRYSHPINVKLESSTAPLEELPFFQADGSTHAGGEIQCFTCHDVHRWDPRSATNRGAQNSEGNASNSFLRIPADRSSELCLVCHTDKKAILTADHNLQMTAAEEKNLQGFSARVSGPCGACHLPHNAAGAKLWAKPLGQGKSFTSQVCTVCHSAGGAATAKIIGAHSHPVNVAWKYSKGPDRQALQKLPLYGDDGDKTDAGKIVCLTCHDPHSWTPGKDASFAVDRPYNMEGDATSSFLRQANYPSSELCKACHPAQARVDGTAHDLALSAPQATNLLGQTVEASGSCGACHLVHNSPYELKLWGRPYGELSDKQSAMDVLCTGCHSEGNIAGKKVPRIATHPKDKLITNIRQYSKTKVAYTLLFDQAGREQTLGDITCASCHNPHQWSPLSREKEGRQDAKDHMNKFRFLRTMSYNTVCIECHGPDGLFRYLYFHIPEKRPQR